MNVNSYVKRIKVSREIDNEHIEKKLVQKRLQVKNTQMKIARANKV